MIGAEWKRSALRKNRSVPNSGQNEREAEYTRIPKKGVTYFRPLTSMKFFEMNVRQGHASPSRSPILQCCREALMLPTMTWQSFLLRPNMTALPPDSSGKRFGVWFIASIRTSQRLFFLSTSPAQEGTTLELIHKIHHAARIFHQQLEELGSLCDLDRRQPALRGRDLRVASQSSWPRDLCGV